MGEGEIKKTEGGIPKDVGVSGVAGGRWDIDTPATDLGGAFNVAIGASKEWFDKAIGFDIFMDGSFKTGKLSAGGGEGTTTSYDSYIFGVKFWRFIKNRLYLDDNNATKHALGPISEKSIGFGWNSYGGNRSVGGENVVETQNEKWPVMTIGGGSGYAWQCFASGRFYFEPFVMFNSSTTIPLVSTDKLGTQRGSPTNIGLQFGIRIGEGGASDEPAKDKAPTKYDNWFDIAGDLLGYVQRGVELRQTIELAKGSNLLDETGLLGDGSGESDPSMTMIPVLQLFQAGFSGLSFSNFISSTKAEYKGDSKAVYGVRVGGKLLVGLSSVIGGFAAGRRNGGEELVASGIPDLAMAAGALLSMADMKSHWSLLIEAIPAAILQVAGPYMDNKGVGTGGMRTMAGLTLNPPSEIVESREVSAGYEGTITGSGGHGTYVALRNYLDTGSKKHRAYTVVKAMTNVVGAVENIATGGENMDVPLNDLTILRTGAGFKEAIPLKEEKLDLDINIEVYTAQQFSGKTTAGGGVYGSAGLNIHASDKANVGFEAGIGVEKMAGANTRTYFDAGLKVEF